MSTCVKVCQKGELRPSCLWGKSVCNKNEHFLKLSKDGQFEPILQQFGSKFRPSAEFDVKNINILIKKDF